WGCSTSPNTVVRTPPCSFFDRERSVVILRACTICKMATTTMLLGNSSVSLSSAARTPIRACRRPPCLAMQILLGSAALLGYADASTASDSLQPSTTIVSADFGKTPTGSRVQIYTLRNRHGMEVWILTYGGVV